MKRKLGSQRGASITYALLAFLVCAALSAAILVAGSKASGRISQIAETDQSYYAVISAAKLLEDLMDGETVSVINVKTREGETPMYRSYTFSKPMNQVKDTDLAIIETDETTTQGETTEINDLAASVAADCLECISNESTADKTFDLTAESGTQSSPGLAVTIQEKIDADGNLTLVIRNALNRKYSLMMEFGTDAKDVRPPVSKFVDMQEVQSSKEVSWHLVRAASAFDISN